MRIFRNSSQLIIPTVNNGGKQESANSTANEDKFLDELAHDEKTTSPIAGKLADIINQRWATKLSDSKLNDRMENTSGRRTATKFSYQGSIKKYGPDSPAKQSVMTYDLLLFKKYSLKLVPFWLNVLTN